MPAEFQKRPLAVKDYHIAWADWLGDGEVVQTSTWTVPNGITEDSSSINVTPVRLDRRTYPTGSVTTVWLSGGTVGTTYELVNLITTNQGRTEPRSVYIEVVRNYEDEE
jgi:hypothetical protein